MITPERRCVGFVLVRLHRRKNSILKCLFQTTHTKRPWAALTPRPTAFSQARPFCVTHGLSMGRSATLSPASCQRLPQKRHSTTLGDTKRMNVKSTPTRAKAPPYSELRRRDSHTNPFLLFYAGILVLL